MSTEDIRTVIFNQKNRKTVRTQKNRNLEKLGKQKLLVVYLSIVCGVSRIFLNDLEELEPLYNA